MFAWASSSIAEFHASSSLRVSAFAAAGRAEISSTKFPVRPFVERGAPIDEQYQSVRDIRSRVLAHAALEICYNSYNGIAMGATGAQVTNNPAFREGGVSRHLTNQLGCKHESNRVLQV